MYPQVAPRQHTHYQQHPRIHSFPDTPLPLQNRSPLSGGSPHRDRSNECAMRERHALDRSSLHASTFHAPEKVHMYRDGGQFTTPRYPTMLEGSPVRQDHESEINPTKFIVPPQQHMMGSEHVLRRKTPNGTLAAGYNGSPMGWSSASTGHIDSFTPAYGSSHHLGRSTYMRPASRQDFSGTPMPWQASPIDQLNERQMPTRSSEFIGDVLPDGQLYTSLQHPEMNWASNHESDPQPTSYFVAHGSQIPTVLQPLPQPGIGPTASNGEGPYGPYWPDGAFIPYRPAAMSDPRYQSSHGTLPWGQTPGKIHQGHLSGGPHYAQCRPAHVLPRRDPHVHPASSVWLPHGQNHSSFQMNARSSGCDPRNHSLPTSASHANMYQGRHPPIRGLANLPSSRIPILQSDHRIPLPHNPHNLEPSHPFRGQAVINGLAAPLAGTAQFKDKALSWAHSVYVDLLAALHQSRRSQHTPHAVTGHQHGARATIYPKPPRQPNSCFGTPQSLESPPAVEYSSGHHPTPNPDQHTRKRVKQNREPASELAFASAYSYAHPSHPSSSVSFNTSDKVRRLRRSSESSTFPNHSRSTDGPPPPITNALAALELVNQLCRESRWQWVDGMLLAGCLAYGLGDYQRALGWYQKILDNDPNHVEAMSNIAASLLSLNRREEAEQYWLRSVKLRPSYFEAVEHLIGLLCVDHRGREAVDIIEYVERSLRHFRPGDTFNPNEPPSETESETSRASSVTPSERSERVSSDRESDDIGGILKDFGDVAATRQPGYGSSGFAIPGSENGRMLALVHAKGNMLYALGQNVAAARAFEDAVLIGSGRRSDGIQGLIRHIARAMSSEGGRATGVDDDVVQGQEAILLLPEIALQTARLVFPFHGELPGLRHVANGMAKRAAISTTSNSLLSLAKIFQDGISTGNTSGLQTGTSGVRDILALYYLSLALQPSPSTANNVGILLAGVQQTMAPRSRTKSSMSPLPRIPGVLPGSGIALALAYYNYGLNLDPMHAHLYTNLGSLLKDIGQLSAAVKMYEQAVQCDGTFDIALANLANAVKDQGRISEAIGYYRRAVTASPEFAEAVCGLANALNSVCGWSGRGGVLLDGHRDRWHVDEEGMLLDATLTDTPRAGWISRVVETVSTQLADGAGWGRGVLQGQVMENLLTQLDMAETADGRAAKRRRLQQVLKAWAGHSWEGARVVRLIERATRRLGWRWYQRQYVKQLAASSSAYTRPAFPGALSIPSAPTVLPFHTFTCPLTAKQIRSISQRNALRISCGTLRAPWLPSTVYPPPAPPAPQLHVGYVSSDFNNHPLAHLMQSVFGLHDITVAKAFCYATTVSDQSVHRQQIQREAPVFHDASSWSAERLVQQIVQDGIHILVNLNGYTRGARNEVFAARPAPIQVSFMGFAGTLGAEWCDYLLADRIAIPPETLRPWRNNVDISDLLRDEQSESTDDWVYSENIIFARDTFFCCDHRQSAPDSQEPQQTWEEEQSTRWQMRKELFPHLKDDAVILGNFNQLYKIEPTTFRGWLRILGRIPNAVLWLLRFPDLGEVNLRHTAKLWAGQEVASRIIFTDVAPKHQHISRARVCDLFLDTPECNAHTTAADVLWSGTPLLTFPRYPYKMCSRMAASILIGALPKSEEGRRAAKELIVDSEQEYEDRVVHLGEGLRYSTEPNRPGRATGRLSELRRLLYEARWTSALFDTRRWVRDLEKAYREAWRKWVAGEGGDIWL